MEPRLVHEKEDVHLLRTFGFSTKMNQARWRVSQQFGHQLAKDALNKDLYAIPERIFNEDLGYGHPKGTKEEEYAEIRENSVGKISKLYGPFYYPDGTGDYYYDFGVKLNGSRAASVIMENGSKTWTPFAVSAHIWPTDGNDDNITGAEFMGLGMVIKGAYGDQSVIKKYCTGGAVKCEQSLAAAIQDVINNSFNSENQNTNIMSTQLQTGTSTGTEDATNIRFNVTPQKPAETVPILETEKKDITLTKEEYDSLQKQLKEQEELRTQITDLRNEHKNTILRQVFSSVEDQNTQENLIKKYFDKDEKLVKELFEDFTANILPKKIEAAVKEAKENITAEKKEGSRTASGVLREEPKLKVKEEEESLTASIEKEVTVKEMLTELGL